jgi:hypothetical protein
MFQQKGGAAAFFVWVLMIGETSGRSSRYARTNHSFAQLLNRYISLHFFGPCVPAHRCARCFANRWHGSCVKLFFVFA